MNEHPATINDALRSAAQLLDDVSDTARLDSELLMAEALGVTRSDLLLHHMQDAPPLAFTQLLSRRQKHEPIAYILGHQEFYGRDYLVTSEVLIPRADSETVVAAALEKCPSPMRVLDCGIGSGALLLTVLAECAGAEGVGVDRSLGALAVAAANAARLGLGERSHMLHRDWTQPDWRQDLGRFDVILANPPYVETDANLSHSVRGYEPASALFAGHEGLDDYRVLLPQLPELLASGGTVVVEIGASQSAAVKQIAEVIGFSVEIRTDLAGRTRALVLQLGLGKTNHPG